MAILCSESRTGGPESGAPRRKAGICALQFPPRARQAGARHGPMGGSGMSVQCHHGSCHCGAVAYDVDVDITNLVSCNCSRCQRLGSVLAFAPRDSFRLLSGEDNLTEYLFNRKVIRHLFCRTWRHRELRLWRDAGRHADGGGQRQLPRRRRPARPAGQACRRPIDLTGPTCHTRGARPEPIPFRSGRHRRKGVQYLRPWPSTLIPGPGKPSPIDPWRSGCAGPAGGRRALRTVQGRRVPILNRR